LKIFYNSNINKTNKKKGAAHALLPGRVWSTNFTDPTVAAANTARPGLGRSVGGSIGKE